MELEDEVRFLYYAAQYALDTTMGLYVPNDRIKLQVMKERDYTLWAKERDYKGYHRREAADRIGRRKKQEDEGKKEVGLCEIIDGNPTQYRVTVTYPEVQLSESNRTLWRALVFGIAAHELAHVWDYEHTKRGRCERDGWGAYALAQQGMKRALDTLQSLLPGVDLPHELHSYDAYEEAVGSHLLQISHQVNYLITQGDNDSLQTAAEIQMTLTNLHLRALDLHARNRIPAQERRLQEGWAEYVKVQALEWFYKVYGVKDLENLPADAPFATSLQQLELWKSTDIPKRLAKKTKVVPVLNGPYTDGLVRLNRLREPERVKAFILKAIKDEELPEF